MLDKALAQSISNTVSSKIVTATKDIKIPEQSWQAIVQIIVEEIFTQITQKAVVKLDPTSLSLSNSSLISSPTGGPVLGAISPPTSPITGKIT